jgi:hypothetical protein
MRPKVSFVSTDIWERLQTCQTVAQAYGWHSNDINSFEEEVRQAFSYEEAMAIIERYFDTNRTSPIRAISSFHPVILQ